LAALGGVLLRLGDPAGALEAYDGALALALDHAASDVDDQRADPNWLVGASGGLPSAPEDGADARGEVRGVRADIGARGRGRRAVAFGQPVAVVGKVGAVGAQGLLAEAARGRIFQHVEGGAEQHVDPDAGQFPPHDPADGVGKFWPPGRADGHVAGHGRQAVQNRVARQVLSLTVDGYQQRQRGLAGRGCRGR
jgi:hypothetical protein